MMYRSMILSLKGLNVTARILAQVVRWPGINGREALAAFAALARPEAGLWYCCHNL